MSSKQEEKQTSKMDFLNKNIEKIGLIWVGILLVVAFSMLLKISLLETILLIIGLVILTSPLLFGLTRLKTIIKKKENRRKEILLLILGIVGAYFFITSLVYNNQKQEMANRKLTTEEREQIVSECVQGADRTVCECAVDYLNGKYSALQIQSFNASSPELQEAGKVCMRSER